MKLQDFDFRIWYEPNKKYMDTDFKGGVYIHKYKTRPQCFVRDISCYDYEFSLNNLADYRTEIELWTGLYDKKGKKIYENDIVRYCDFENLIINFLNGIFIASPNYDEFIKKCRYKKDDEIAREDWFEASYKLYRQAKNGVCDRLEIIGNIHENAELLK